MDVIGGTSATLLIRFENAGRPVIPNVGSVTFTVLDHVGVPLPAMSDVPMTTTNTTTHVSLVIPGSENFVGASRLFDKRTVVVNYLQGDAARQIRLSYRVIPQPLYATDPQAVRAFLGLPDRDLPDDVIDIFHAYLQTRAEVITLDEALISGDMAEINANEAITMKAVLMVIPSLQQRLAQRESNGILEFQRLSIKDFRDLERAAAGRYAAARDSILGTQTVDAEIFMLTTTTDPFTGA